MGTATLIQLVGACAGVIGSLFFAIGVMRQTVATMGDIAGSYFDWNPHMARALAAQKAEYLFGGGIIVLSFALQLSAFLVPTDSVVPFSHPRYVPWSAAGLTVVCFAANLVVSRLLAKRFERQITSALEQRLRSEANAKR